MSLDPADIDPVDYFDAMRSGTFAERCFHRRRVSMLMRAIEPRGLRALDVGAGSGCLAIPLAEAGASVTAVEPGEDHVARLVSRANERGLGIDAVRGEGAHLPFADASFDVVVLASVVHLAREVEPLLAEAERVCRRGGKLVLAGPWRRHPKNIHALKRLLSGGKPVRRPVRPFSARSLRPLMPGSRLLRVRRDRLIGYDVSVWLRV